MAWIESHQSLLNHPKTIAACAYLKVDRFKFLGHLHALWWWALDVVDQDGLFPPRCTDLVIALGAGWTGKAPDFFVSALVDAGFIDEHFEEDREVRNLHDWYDYAGKLNARRVRNKEAMRATRGAHVDTTEDTRVKLPTNQPPQPYQPTEPTQHGVFQNGASTPLRHRLNLTSLDIASVREAYPNADINGRWKEWIEWIEEREEERSPKKEKMTAFMGWMKKNDGSQN